MVGLAPIHFVHPFGLGFISRIDLRFDQMYQLQDMRKEMHLLQKLLFGMWLLRMLREEMRLGY